MIEGYQQGSNITLLNTIYLRPRKDEQSGKWSKDKLITIYKDLDTGEKKYEEIESPKYDYYMAKKDEYIDHNLLFIEKDKVNKITVPYNSLEKKIAEETGNLEFFYDNIKAGNRYANKKLLMHPRVFMCDQQIEDRTRFNFDKDYKNQTYPISKAYFDIEADTIHMKGDFPEMGECPINAVTIINDNNKTVYTLLLRNKENPLIKEFEDSINDKMFIELKDFVRDKVGGWKNEIRFGLDKFKYEMMFYDEEEEIRLIHDLFVIINATKPDFVLVWNMAFDMPYIMERIKKLGYNPEDIICHPDFKTKVASYFKDIRNDNDFAERGDFATISSYSVFLDQLIHFASRRKGQGKFPDYKLDTIGNLIAGVRKYDYSHITTSIAKLPYLDYKTFVFYNIMDTIVQKCIEMKVGDMDYVFNKCLMNHTRYQKCHRQTVYLVNRGQKEFYNDGYIIGNNMNRYNEKGEKYPGAFVSLPTNFDSYAKQCIYGNPIDIIDNCDDFDYKSLYPSIMRETNMAPNTQIGMINIPNQVDPNENRFNREKYTRGSAFIEDFHSHNFIEFCTRYFNMADYSTLVDDTVEYFTNERCSAKPVMLHNFEGQRIAVKFNNFKESKRSAIVFNERDEKRKVISFAPNTEMINSVSEYYKGDKLSV